MNSIRLFVVRIISATGVVHFTTKVSFCSASPWACCMHSIKRASFWDENWRQETDYQEPKHFLHQQWKPYDMHHPGGPKKLLFSPAYRRQKGQNDCPHRKWKHSPGLWRVFGSMCHVSPDFDNCFISWPKPGQSAEIYCFHKNTSSTSWFEREIIDNMFLPRRNILFQPETHDQAQTVLYFPFVSACSIGRVVLDEGQASKWASQAKFLFDQTFTLNNMTAPRTWCPKILGVRNKKPVPVHKHNTENNWPMLTEKHGSEIFRWVQELTLSFNSNITEPGLDLILHFIPPFFGFVGKGCKHDNHKRKDGDSDEKRQSCAEPAPNLLPVRSIVVTRLVVSIGQNWHQQSHHAAGRATDGCSWKVQLIWMCFQFRRVPDFTIFTIFTYRS